MSSFLLRICGLLHTRAKAVISLARTQIHKNLQKIIEELFPSDGVFIRSSRDLRRSARDDKSRAIFVVGLVISLSIDPFGLDGAF